VTLSVDANSTYTLADMKRWQSSMILSAYDRTAAGSQRPVGSRRVAADVCLYESIPHADISRPARAIGACLIINIKLGRVGGHSEARRVHD
jgi:O-succinylbenzoate synthase